MYFVKIDAYVFSVKTKNLDTTYIPSNKKD